jgi:hypothetical protein
MLSSDNVTSHKTKILNTDVFAFGRLWKSLIHNFEKLWNHNNWTTARQDNRRPE